MCIPVPSSFELTINLLSGSKTPQKTILQYIRTGSADVKVNSGMGLIYKKEANELMGALWLVKAHPEIPMIHRLESIEHRTDELYGQYHDIDFFSDGVQGGLYLSCWDENEGILVRAPGLEPGTP